MTMIPPAISAAPPDHAENRAGHVGLGNDQDGTDQQQRKTERGHVKSSTTMIRLDRRLHGRAGPRGRRPV